MTVNTSPSPDYSVVILCYRAGDSISNFVDSVLDCFTEGSIDDFELILVGNYWPNRADKTPEIVEKIAESDHRIIAITREKEGAMGWDMRMGLDLARGQYIAIIDGDGQVQASDLVRVYKKIRNENFDLVKTVRRTREDGLPRRLISFIYNRIFNILFPNVTTTDINAKPKILRRDCYRKLKLRSNDWFIDSEILIQACALQFKVGEVHSHFLKHPKSGGSHIGFLAILEFIYNLIRFKLIEMRRRRK